MLVGIAPGVRVLERYEIVERLPEYGLGEAWRAKDTSGRAASTVVLKFLRELPPGQAGLPHALDQHLHALRSLLHGNIVRTLGHGLYERRPVVVHAHFAARSLAFGLRPQDGPPPELIERLHDRVVAALVAARDARGVAHGAIDPRSVLVARAGPQNFELRVLDFGLAPYADWLHGGEEFHALATRRPPEWSNGAAATAASEVFALGEFTRVLFGEAPAFTRPRRDVPSAAWRAVLRATAAAPADRYASIDDFQADFQRLWRTPSPPPAPRAEVAAKTLLDVDATVIEPKRAKPNAAKRSPPPPPPVAQFPERVMERAAQPRQDAAVLVLPPLPHPATPPTPALTLQDDADVTVRVSHMAKQASPWDNGAVVEPTEVYAPPAAQPPVEPPPPPPPPAPPPPSRHDDAKAPEPADAELAVDEDELREERRMRWLLGAVVVAVVGLTGALVALLSSRG